MNIVSEYDESDSKENKMMDLSKTQAQKRMTIVGCKEKNHLCLMCREKFI